MTDSFPPAPERQCWNIRAISSTLSIISDHYVLETWTPNVLVRVLDYLTEQLDENLERIEKEIFGKDYEGGLSEADTCLKKRPVTPARPAAADERNGEEASAQ